MTGLRVGIAGAGFIGETHLAAWTAEGATIVVHDVERSRAVALADRVGERAVAGLADAGRWLGIGIGNLIVLLTPERVVIGGGVAGAGDLLLGPIRAEVRERVHMTALEGVRIVLAELGTRAGSIGAAVYGAERAAEVQSG